MKAKWTFFILLIFLSACGGGGTTPSAKLTLAATLNGANVDLKATITEGATNVATVDFAVEGGAVVKAGVKASSEGSYSSSTPAPTKDTVFVATAKNAEGTTVGSAKQTFKASTARPNAENKEVTTLAGIPVVGGTATELAVVTGKLVAENGTPEKVAGSEVGGVATLTDNEGSFTFTPDDGFAGAASFKYKVVSGASSDEGTVTVTVTPLPADTKIAKTLADLEDATLPTSSVKTILVSGTITCGPQDCIQLKGGQKLLGTGVIEGVTLAGVAKLDATVSVAESIPPTENNITVIKLAPNSSVEGIEISGRDIFSAISGQAVELRQPGSPADNPTPSTVTIKNVKIVGPTSDAPFTIRFTGPTAGEEFEAYYDLNIDGLTVTEVGTKSIGIVAFSSLEFKNSTIAISASGTAETGVTVRAYSGPVTATIETVTFTSAKGGAAFSPLEVAQNSGGGVLEVTVKDTTVTFADEVDKLNAFPFYFNFGNPGAGAGKIVINTASTGNTSNTTSPDSVRWSNPEQIEGTIEVNGTPIPAP